MSKRRPSAGPTRVKDILGHWLKPADWRQLELQATLREAWEKSVSPAVVAHTRLVEFKRKVLIVEVATHAWLQELHFLKPKILADMQQLLGPKLLKDLRFRLP